MEYFDLFIIGGGAAGIAAAKAAWKTMEEAACLDDSDRMEVERNQEKSQDCHKKNKSFRLKIALCDRGPITGGVLRQCLHKGFGHQLTGVEYAEKLMEDFPDEITCFYNSTVLEVKEDKRLVLSSGEEGLQEIAFDRLILATGCMEVPAGALAIAGTRPEGVYTAGEMQAMMNLEGFVPEDPVVILGSGDLGLIMADAVVRRGLSVTLVERESSCGGLARNRGPVESGAANLITNASIREICGDPRLESVVLSEGPEGKEGRRLYCKTLLIAAGLRPDQQLIQGMEDREWLTLCGNCRQVHPMVEGVVSEAAAAGTEAATALYLMKKEAAKNRNNAK